MLFHQIALLAGVIRLSGGNALLVAMSGKSLSTLARGKGSVQIAKNVGKLIAFFILTET